jgi:hypothetical protein
MPPLWQYFSRLLRNLWARREVKLQADVPDAPDVGGASAAAVVWWREVAWLCGFGHSG